MQMGQCLFKSRGRDLHDLRLWRALLAGIEERTPHPPCVRAMNGLGDCFAFYIANRCYPQQTIILDQRWKPDPAPTGWLNKLLESPEFVSQ